MHTNSIELTQGLLRHFNISEYQQAKNGGQKSVFIVTIEQVKYALKIIKVADERFKREVDIGNEFKANHGIPYITRVEKYGNETIILEEYIEGQDLSELISNYKGNKRRIFQLLFDVSTILTPVWNSRYVHRDLKPQNIRIKDCGTPVVLDFGIARALDDDSITSTGGQPLTWAFASPEQYSGKKHLISYRTDFFCLGIIAYFLFTGELPFGKNKIEIEQRFKNNNLNVETTDNDINNFCNGVFKINPSERPRNPSLLLKLIKV